MGRKSLLLISTLVIFACSEQGGNRQAPVSGNTPAAFRPPPDVSGTPIMNQSGKQIGMVAARLEKSDVAIMIDTVGLTPGLHGVHIHQNAKCDPPTFESAGAHWNWTNKEHGHENPRGSHAGDLGNLTVGSDGRGQALFRVPLNEWDPKQVGGLPVIIDASVDDEMTDPSGKSGARIACGVVYLRRD